MATTEPLSGVVVYQQTDQALGGQQMGEIVNEFGPLLNLRYATTGARDAAFNSWIAAGTGRSIPTGSSVFVGTRQYVYQSGWQAVAAFRGTGTALPSDPINGDTFYHTTYRCTLRYRGSSWVQADVTLVTSDTDRAAFLSALTAAGLTMHNGFQVFQTNTDVLYESNGSLTLLRVASPGFLKQATGVDKPAGSTSVAAVSVTVTIPDGLPSTRRIKVDGKATVVCPTGVGAVVILGDVSRAVNASFQGDLGATFYDSDLTPGSRTYTLYFHSTVSANINFYAPVLQAEVV